MSGEFEAASCTGKVRFANRSAADRVQHRRGKNRDKDRRNQEAYSCRPMPRLAHWSPQRIRAAQARDAPLESAVRAMNGMKLRRRRQTLFAQQGGLCHWCKIPMRELPPMPRRKQMPNDMCTLDHLFDRFDPNRRRKPKPGEQRLVAACWECNNRRGIERQAELSKKTLQRRSGRHPQPQRAPAAA